ncbi:hypothetical protein [Microbulbifer sp. Q7]|uniref:hypothetical protein n=1 Tax=Microbulbifer sp. Q7 TaxID=1785091 RepID=UPI0012901F1D|nr:hypothetical protein [Microbulbifer sp. Q7]
MKKLAKLAGRLIIAGFGFGVVAYSLVLGFSNQEIVEKSQTISLFAPVLGGCLCVYFGLSGIRSSTAVKQHNNHGQ